MPTNYLMQSSMKRFHFYVEEKKFLSYNKQIMFRQERKHVSFMGKNF